MGEFYGTMSECHEWLKSKGLTRAEGLGWWHEDIGLGVIQYVGLFERPEANKEYCAHIRSPWPH